MLKLFHQKMVESIKELTNRIEILEDNNKQLENENRLLKAAVDEFKTTSEGKLSLISTTDEEIKKDYSEKYLSLRERLERVEIDTRINNENRLWLVDYKDSIVRNQVKLKKLENQLLVFEKQQNHGGQLEEVDVETANSKDVYEEIDYWDFEAYFRGETSEIKQRQSIYLPYFENCKKVFDVGCGRGEFLELLNENGIGARGCDLFDEFVIYCQQRGLDVIHGDALESLSNVESVDGVFAGQIVEHLTLSQIIRLCKIAYNKLEKNGYLIMETPNPMSLSIFTNAFYIDPSHQKPVHPLLLKYLAEKAGFSQVEILFTDVSKEGIEIPKLSGEENQDFNKAMEIVQNRLFGSQDYSVIARK